MKTLKAPPRLRAVALLTLAAIPLMAFQAALMAQVTWWQLPLQSIQVWTLSVSLLVLPLSVWLSRGSTLAWICLSGLAFVWTSATIAAAIRLGSFWLGLFSLVLAIYWYAVVSLIYVELRRAYLAPALKWFMGRAKVISGLTCEVQLPDGARKFPVSHFDRFGACLAADNGFELNTRSKLRVQFEAADARIRVAAEAVMLSRRQGAVGIKFCDLSPDREKMLKDFVEVLRGGGRV